MLGLHGFNLARIAVMRRANLRVLYISGHDEMPEVARDTGSRFGALLHKPIRPAEFCAAMDKVLASPPPSAQSTRQRRGYRPQHNREMLAVISSVPARSPQ